MPRLKKDKNEQQDIELVDLNEERARKEAEKKYALQRKRIGSEIEFAKELYEKTYVKEASAKAFSKISMLLVRYNRMAAKNQDYNEAENNALAEEEKNFKEAMLSLASKRMEISEMKDPDRQKASMEALDKKEADLKRDHLSRQQHIKKNIASLKADAARSIDRDDGAIRGALMLGGDTAFGKGYTLTDGGYLDTMKAGEYIEDVAGEHGTLMGQMSLLDNAVNTAGIDLDRGRGHGSAAKKNLGEILREVNEEDIAAMNAGSGEKLELDLGLIKKNREDGRMDELIGEKKKKLTVDEAAEERGLVTTLEKKGRFRKGYTIKQYGLTQTAKDRRAGKIGRYSTPEAQAKYGALFSKDNTSFMKRSPLGTWGTFSQRAAKTINTNDQDERRRIVEERRLLFMAKLKEAESRPKIKPASVNKNDSFDYAMKHLRTEEVEGAKELEKLGIFDKDTRKQIEEGDSIDRVMRISAQKESSGTATHMISAYRMLGAGREDLLNFRLALIAYLVPTGKATVAQIVNESHAAGLVGAEGPGNVEEKTDQSELFKLLKVGADTVLRMEESEEDRRFKWSADKKRYDAKKLGIDIPEEQIEKERDEYYRFNSLSSTKIGDENYDAVTGSGEEPLFGEKGQIDVSDIKEGRGEDSYLCAALAGLAKSDPDYIKTRLIVQHESDPKLVKVRLYDLEGIQHIITVSKKRIALGSDIGALWVNLVEKAAVLLLSQSGDKAGFAPKEKVSPGKLGIGRIKNGSGDLAMRLLFGKHMHEVISTGMDTEDKEEAEKSGKAALSAIEDGLAGNKIITVTSGPLARNGMRSIEKLESMGLRENREYTVIGTGADKDGKRTIRLRDPKGFARFVKEKKKVVVPSSVPGEDPREITNIYMDNHEKGEIDIIADDFLQIFGKVTIAATPDKTVRDKEDKALKRSDIKFGEGAEKEEEKLPEFSITAGDEKYSLEQEQTDNEPLFGENGEVKVKDIRQGDTYDCYLLAALAGLADRDPGYIKNTLVKDNAPGDPGTVTVRLYNEMGMAMNITVTKKRAAGGAKNSALWVHMVEKAAAEMVGRTSGAGAGFKKAEAGGGKNGIMDLGKGSEGLAMQLLFGNDRYKVYNTRSKVTPEEEAEGKKSGDRQALDAMLEAFEKKQVVIASTCKRSENEEYDPDGDSVKLLPGLKETHEYTVLGLGKMVDGEITLKLRDPYGMGTTVPGKGNGTVDASENGIFEIKYKDFLHCFSNVAVGSPEKKEAREDERKIEGLPPAGTVGIAEAFDAMKADSEHVLILQWKELGNTLWDAGYVEIGPALLSDIMEDVDGVTDLLADLIPEDKTPGGEMSRKISAIKHHYYEILQKSKLLVETVAGKDIKGSDVVADAAQKMGSMAAEQLFSFTRGCEMYRGNKAKEKEIKPFAYMVLNGEKALAAEDEKKRKRAETADKAVNASEEALAELDGWDRVDRWNDMRLRLLHMVTGKHDSGTLKDVMTKMESLAVQLGKSYKAPKRGELVIAGAAGSGRINDDYRDIAESALALSRELLDSAFEGNDKAAAIAVKIASIAHMEEIFFRMGRRMLVEAAAEGKKPIWADALEMGRKQYVKEEEQLKAQLKAGIVEELQQGEGQQGQGQPEGQGQQQGQEGQQVGHEPNQEQQGQPVVQEQPEVQEPPQQEAVNKAPIDLDSSIDGAAVLQRWNELTLKLKSKVDGKYKNKSLDGLLKSIGQLTGRLGENIPKGKYTDSRKLNAARFINSTYEKIYKQAMVLAGQLSDETFEGFNEASKTAALISIVAQEEKQYFSRGRYNESVMSGSVTWSEVVGKGKDVKEEPVRQPVVNLFEGIEEEDIFGTNRPALEGDKGPGAAGEEKPEEKPEEKAGNNTAALNVPGFTAVETDPLLNPPVQNAEPPKPAEQLMEDLLKDFNEDDLFGSNRPEPEASDVPGFIVAETDPLLNPTVQNEEQPKTEPAKTEPPKPAQQPVVNLFEGIEEGDIFGTNRPALEGDKVPGAAGEEKPEEKTEEKTGDNTALLNVPGVTIAETDPLLNPPVQIIEPPKPEPVNTEQPKTEPTKTEPPKPAKQLLEDLLEGFNEDDLFGDNRPEPEGNKVPGVNAADTDPLLDPEEFEEGHELEIEPPKTVAQVVQPVAEPPKVVTQVEQPVQEPPKVVVQPVNQTEPPKTEPPKTVAQVVQPVQEPPKTVAQVVQPVQKVEPPKPKQEEKAKEPTKAAPPKAAHPKAEEKKSMFADAVDLEMDETMYVNMWVSDYGRLEKLIGKRVNDPNVLIVFKAVNTLVIDLLAQLPQAGGAFSDARKKITGSYGIIRDKGATLAAALAGTKPKQNKEAAEILSGMSKRASQESKTMLEGAKQELKDRKKTGQNKQKIWASLLISGKKIIDEEKAMNAAGPEALPKTQMAELLVQPDKKIIAKKKPKKKAFNPDLSLDGELKQIEQQLDQEGGNGNAQAAGEAGHGNEPAGNGQPVNGQPVNGQPAVNELQAGNDEHPAKDDLDDWEVIDPDLEADKEVQALINNVQAIIDGENQKMDELKAEHDANVAQAGNKNAQIVQVLEGKGPKAGEAQPPKEEEVQQPVGEQPPKEQEVQQPAGEQPPKVEAVQQPVIEVQQAGEAKQPAAEQPEKKGKKKKVNKAAEMKALDKGAKLVGKKSYTPVTVGTKAQNRTVSAFKYIWGAAMLPVNLAGAGIGKLLLVGQKKKRPEKVQENREGDNKTKIAGQGKISLAQQQAPMEDGKTGVYEDVRAIPLVWERITAGEPEEAPEMSINVDQPVAGSRKTTSGIHVGHTFITLSYTRFNISTDRKERYRLDYGFYPKDGFTGLGLAMNQGMRATVPGMLKDDKGHGYSISKKYSITNEKVNDVLKESEHYSAGGYNMYSRNCTTFAADMGRIAGIPVAEQIKETEYDNGALANAGTVFMGGLAPTSRYFAERDFEKQLAADDTGYENFGQKNATMEELQRFKDTRELMPHTPKGYSPAQAGEVLRYSENDAGELGSNVSLDQMVLGNNNLADGGDRFTGVVRDAFNALYKAQREAGGLSKEDDELIGGMIHSMADRKVWSHIRNIEFGQEDIKALHKDLNTFRKKLTGFISKKPDYLEVCRNDMMTLLSIVESSLMRMDEIYEKDLGDEYKGDLKTARKKYDRTDAILNYKDIKQIQHRIDMEPSMVEAYLQIYGSMDKALPAMEEYQRLSAELSIAENKGDKKEAARLNALLEKPREIHDTAKVFAASHRYRMNKKSFDKEDMDYAFKQLPAMEEAREMQLSGPMLESRSNPSALLQAVIFEPVFKGLTEKIADINNMTGVKKTAEFVGSQLYDLAKGDDNREAIRNILEYRVDNAPRYERNDDSVAEWFLKGVCESYLPNVLLYAMGDAQKAMQVSSVVRLACRELKDLLLDIIRQIVQAKRAGQQ